MRFRLICERLFGRVCPVHDHRYRSDFCPPCLRARDAREQRVDRRPEWTKAEGPWPRRKDVA